MKIRSDVWVEQRAVNEFLVVINIKLFNIYNRLLVVYGNETFDVVLFVFGHYELKVSKSKRPLLPIRIEVGGS